MDFQTLIQSKKYDFLRSHSRLGKRIMILGAGGSYAYGTNNENSDSDIRGITLNKVFWRLMGCPLEGETKGSQMGGTLWGT